MIGRIAADRRSGGAGIFRLPEHSRACTRI